MVTPRRRLIWSLLMALSWSGVGLRVVVPAFAESIQLQQEGGVYKVPVQLNGQLTIPFTLDTGAFAVAITEDVFNALKRTGTVQERDFLGAGTIVVADGSKHESLMFVLHEVKVGNHKLNNVVANVVPTAAEPLLGQSFLSKLPSWSIDNQHQTLVLHDDAPKMTTTAPVPRTTDPNILIKLWAEAYGTCRGSNVEAEICTACNARDTYTGELKAIGWCYGKQGQDVHQMGWHKCGPTSLTDTPGMLHECD